MHWATRRVSAQEHARARKLELPPAEAEDSARKRDSRGSHKQRTVAPPEKQAACQRYEIAFTLTHTCAAQDNCRRVLHRCWVFVKVMVCLFSGRGSFGPSNGFWKMAKLYVVHVSCLTKVETTWWLPILLQTTPASREVSFSPALFSSQVLAPH